MPPLWLCTSHRPSTDRFMKRLVRTASGHEAVAPGAGLSNVTTSERMYAPECSLITLTPTRAKSSVSPSLGKSGIRRTRPYAPYRYLHHCESSPDVGFGDRLQP